MKAIDRLRERFTLKKDYEETFSSEQGQRVLAHILKVAGVTRPKFNANNELTRINEGERRLAYSIYRMVYTSDKSLISLMEDELNHDQEEI